MKQERVGIPVGGEAMATGACGIDCGVCKLRLDGKCSTCGAGTSQEASRKFAAQVRLLGAPCPVLECARQRKVDYCMRDCGEFPCIRFQQGPYPFSSSFLLMQERRREAPMPESYKPGRTVPVDEVHWKNLAQLNPQEVSTRCRCPWDPETGFRMDFLGESYWVNPRSQKFTPVNPEAPVEPYLPLVLVIFLLKALDLPLENRMVRERELPGGELFFRHLHSLPSHVLEDTFGSRPADFLQAALALGARRLDISPASVEFLPLPRIPVAVHLWPADEEFAARCTFTFDASIHMQLPLDAIWALVQVLVQRILWRASR